MRKIFSTDKILCLINTLIIIFIFIINALNIPMPGVSQRSSPGTGNVALGVCGDGAPPQWVRALQGRPAHSRRWDEQLRGQSLGVAGEQRGFADVVQSEIQHGHSLQSCKDRQQERTMREVSVAVCTDNKSGQWERFLWLSAQTTRVDNERGFCGCLHRQHEWTWERFL